MTLGELIEVLEAEDLDKVVKHGFDNPNSYRGDYSQLAFAPTSEITVYEMLKCAVASIGRTFQGYKGGDYRMSLGTNVYLAQYGDVGEELGPTLLKYMLADTVEPEDDLRDDGGPYCDFEGNESHYHCVNCGGVAASTGHYDHNTGSFSCHRVTGPWDRVQCGLEVNANPLYADAACSYKESVWPTRADGTVPQDGDIYVLRGGKWVAEPLVPRFGWVISSNVPIGTTD